jgi:hypothetical protein
MDPKLNYPKVYMNGTTIKGLYSKSDVFFGWKYLNQQSKRYRRNLLFDHA